MRFCRCQAGRKTYVKDHQDDAHNFLLVEVVKNLADGLDDGNLVVTELLQSERVERQDPQRAADIVGNLSVLEAVVLEEALHEVEALAVNKVAGQLISLAHVHQAVRECNLRQVCLVSALCARLLLHKGVRLVEQVVHEVFGRNRALLELVGLNEHRKSVGSEIAVVLLVNFVTLDEEAVQDADQVQLAGLIS